MYAFRVMVTTLILIMMGTLIYAVFNSKAKSGVTIALVMIIIHSLSIVAIWG